MSGRDDKILFRNHDINLVIGIALMFCWTLVGLMSGDGV